VWDLHTEKLEKTLKAPRGVLCLQFDEQKIVRDHRHRHHRHHHLATIGLLHT
jgi:hypothetical protein